MTESGQMIIQTSSASSVINITNPQSARNHITEEDEVCVIKERETNMFNYDESNDPTGEPSDSGILIQPSNVSLSHVNTADSPRRPRNKRILNRPRQTLILTDSQRSVSISHDFPKTAATGARGKESPKRLGNCLGSLNPFSPGVVREPLSVSLSNPVTISSCKNSRRGLLLNITRHNVVTDLAIPTNEQAHYPSNKQLYFHTRIPRRNVVFLPHLQQQKQEQANKMRSQAIVDAQTKQINLIKIKQKDAQNRIKIVGKIKSLIDELKDSRLSEQFKYELAGSLKTTQVNLIMQDYEVLLKRVYNAWYKQKMNESAAKIQAWFRSRKIQIGFRELVRKTRMIQRNYRNHLKHTVFLRFSRRAKANAAVRIQKYLRGYLVNKRVGLTVRKIVCAERIKQIDYLWAPIRMHIIESLQIKLAYIFRKAKAKRIREAEERELEQREKELRERYAKEQVARYAKLKREKANRDIIEKMQELEKKRKQDIKASRREALKESQKQHQQKFGRQQKDSKNANNMPSFIQNQLNLRKYGSQHVKQTEKLKQVKKNRRTAVAFDSSSGFSRNNQEYIQPRKMHSKELVVDKLDSVSEGSSFYENTPKSKNNMGSPENVRSRNLISSGSMTSVSLTSVESNSSVLSQLAKEIAALEAEKRNRRPTASHFNYLQNRKFLMPTQSFISSSNTSLKSKTVQGNLKVKQQKSSPKNRDVLKIRAQRSSPRSDLSGTNSDLNN